MKRRKNNEGHYGEKTIKGVVYKYYRFPGMGVEVYARTAKELEAKKKKKGEELRIAADLDNPAKKTVYVICVEWLKGMSVKVSARTYDDYESVIEKRIKEDFDFGNMQADSLTVRSVNDFLLRLARKYAKASVDKTWTVLKRVIVYGQDNGIISRGIDLQKVVKPGEKDVAVKKREIHFIDIDDMESLYKECYRVNGQGKPYYGRGSKMVVFIMYSGTRISEATSLKWRHVSKDFSSVKIRETLSRVIEREPDGEAIVEDGRKRRKTIQKGPKTESGERTIPLPDRAIEVIRYFSELYPDHKPDDFVFLTDENTTYSRTNVNHTLKRILMNSSCACKEYTPHSLRHGYGSVLLSEGVDIKVVSKLLGHKDISTTYNIYIHVIKDDDRKAILRVFNKKEDK